MYFIEITFDNKMGESQFMEVMFNAESIKEAKIKSFEALEAWMERKGLKLVYNVRRKIHKLNL